VTRPSKAHIEAAAADLLARDGFNGMGLKALSEATGLPFGSIYHHFPGGKEEIAATAILANATVVSELLEANLADGVTDDAIRRMFSFMADRLEASAWSMGCVVGTPSADDPAGSPRVAAAVTAGFALIVDPIAAALGRDGRLSGDARALALTIVSTYEGATLLARARRSREPLEAAAESMIRLVGLTAEG
jgi:TetR/AcrR family transcriptional regulator, lmrAB and yxaGH operons repressor